MQPIAGSRDRWCYACRALIPWRNLGAHDANECEARRQAAWRKSVKTIRAIILDYWKSTPKR